MNVRGGVLPIAFDQAPFAISVLANIAWHMSLLFAVKLTDRWIEFSTWYWYLAVIVPPLATVTLYGLAIIAQPNRRRTGLFAMAISIALAIAHSMLIREAAAIV